MLCFVILNYMSFEETIRVVKQVRKIKGSKKIIIIDNNSPNGSFEILQEEFRMDQDVTLIRNKTNMGFAKGNNVGYLYAKRNFSPDYIIVMNNDIIFENDDLMERLDKSFEKFNFDILGPDIKTVYSGQHQNPVNVVDYSLRDLKKKERILFIKNLIKPLYWLKWKLVKKPIKRKQNTRKKRIDEPCIGAMLHGSFLVFSANFIKENNECFFPGTFMYMEAEILHFIAEKSGYKSLYDPSIEVKHKDDVSTNLVYTDRYSKAVFSNKQLLFSTRQFIKLREGKSEKQL